MRSKSRGRLGLAALLAVLAAAAWRETSTAPFQVEVQPRVQSWAQQGRFINHRGNPIFVTQSEGCRDASAPRVLTLHGFPTSSYDFRDVWPTAGRTLCLIAPDFLGFGLSGKPFHHSYSLMEQADIAERVLAELNVTQAHVFAHDYGDTVTLELIARQLDSLRHPEMPHPTWRLQTVTLLNGGVLPDKHRPLFMQKLLAHRTVGAAARLFITRRLFARSFAKVFGARTQPSERELDEHWTLVVRNNGNHVVDKLLGYMEERKRHERRWSDALRQCFTPIQLVCGPADPVSGAHLCSAVEAMWHSRSARAAPSRVASLAPDVGHYPQNEAAGEVAALLQEWVQQSPGMHEHQHHVAG